MLILVQLDQQLLLAGPKNNADKVYRTNCYLYFDVMLRPLMTVSVKLDDQLFIIMNCVMYFISFGGVGNYIQDAFITSMSSVYVQLNLLKLRYQINFRIRRRE